MLTAELEPTTQESDTNEVPSAPVDLPCGHAPLWEIRRASARSPASENLVGRLEAAFEFFAQGDPGDPAVLPSITDEAVVQPLNRNVQQSLDDLRIVQHYRKLQVQQVAAQRRHQLARAHIAELNGKRTALEIEVPPNLAKRLQAIDEQLSQQAGLLAEVEKEIGVLAPLVEQSRKTADTEIWGIICQHAATLRQNLDGRWDATLDKIVAAIGPHLNELVMLRRAINKVEHQKENVLSAMRTYLAAPPVEPVAKSTE